MHKMRKFGGSSEEDPDKVKVTTVGDYTEEPSTIDDIKSRLSRKRKGGRRRKSRKQRKSRRHRKSRR